MLSLFKKIRSKYKNTKLVMIGAGKYLDEYKMMMQAIGIDKDVCFTGGSFKCK